MKRRSSILHMDPVLYILDTPDGVSAVFFLRHFSYSIIDTNNTHVCIRQWVATCNLQRQCVIFLSLLSNILIQLICQM